MNAWLNKRFGFCLVAAVLLLILSACGPGEEGLQTREAQSQAADETESLADVGRQKSRTCMGCHGPRGISRTSSYPSLAGLSEDYLQSQLKAFRSGKRENPMMESMARNLTDQDIQALSRYYSELPAPEAGN